MLVQLVHSSKIEIRAAVFCGLANLLISAASALFSRPPYWCLLGLAVYLIGLSLAAWARAANPFFVRELKMPPRLIVTGPYHYLRHPGYVGFVLMSVGAFFAGGSSVYAVPFLLAYLLILWRRVRCEDKLLYGELNNETSDATLRLSSRAL